MSEVILVEAQPWAPDGTPVSVRLAGGGSRGYTHRGYLDWVPGVASRPRFTAQIGFDVAQGGFTGGAIPTTGALGFLPSDPAVIAAIAQLVWTDAPIIVRVGDDDLADPLWTTLLVGTVAGMVVRGGQASFTIADLSRDLAKPLLTDRFAGTGGVEGIAEAKERIKRRSWGRCWNVEARILDKANNIYELGDPARPLLAIDAVKDKGRAADQVTVLGWQGSIAATFAALQAASVPAGGAVVAPSIACVKWWTQPVGPLTADLRGEIGLSYVEACAAIAARVIAARAPTMAVNGVAEAIAARPGACGLHVDQDSETAGQALDRLLLGASLLWIVEPTGAVRLAPIAFTGAVETLVAIEAEREAVYKPVTERLLGYQRNQRQHSDGELSAVFQASDGTYRDGTPIEDLKPAERGANVTQTNVAAAVAGQGALATRNFADWASQVQGAGKPQDGATVGAITGGNLISGYGRGVMTDDGIFTQIGTAAAIAGQGQLATQSAVTWVGQITGRPTPLVDGIVAGSYFDARYTQNPIDGYLLHQRWPAEFGANVTETRVASAISGQSAWATFGAVAPVTVTARISRIQDDGYIYSSTVYNDIGSAGVLRDRWPAEFGANVTESRVASAISGQGQLATQNAVTYGGQISGLPAPIQPGNITSAGLLDARYAQYWGGPANVVVTIDSLRPQEAGANVTESRVASAIAGQGPLATQSAVTWGGQITGRPTPLVDGIVAGSYFDARYTQNPIDGYLLHQRWPAEFGANVTETRVASAIAGQGLLATRSYADWATQVVGTGKPEDRATNDRGDDTRNDDFSPAYYRANYLRRLRTEFKSLAVVGVGGGGSYGTFETYAQWSDASGGPVWQRVTDSAGRRFIRQSVSEAAWGAWQPEYSGNRRPGFGDGDLLETYGGAVATLGNFKTGLGTAAAISGQGSLATRNDVLYDSQISGLPVPIQPGNLRDGQRIAADQVQYWSGPAQVVVTVDSLRPQEAGANVTESRVASAVAGQSPWATYGGLAPGNVAGQVQGLDTAGNLSGLTRVIDRRLTLLVRADGTTVVTETLVVTAIGVAAAIAGQGAGATANNLAQLDPTAASQLAAVAGGGIQVAALYGTIRKVMAADATLNFDAAASIGAGGNSGTVRVVIQVSPAGAESWSDVAVGAEAFVSASEPAEVTVSGSFTNTSGVQQVLEIRAVDRRTPASAGGAVIASQSFLRG